METIFRAIGFENIYAWQEASHWEIVEPLPSYGRGLELPGGRHRSLINGYLLHDVVVTGRVLQTWGFKFDQWLNNIFSGYLVTFISHDHSYIIALGDNGTIDGQGSVWWEWFTSHSLNYSRPHLVEFIGSKDIVVSNLTFLNAPAFNIHPVYCRWVDQR